MTSTPNDPTGGRRRPPPPVVTHPRGTRAARAVSVFAPPFAAGRTLSRNRRAVESAEAIGSDWPLLEEEGAAVSTWDMHEPLPEDSVADFPLDAFIIPEDSRSIPSGWTDERATAFANSVADRLEALALRVREDGMAALAALPDDDEISRSIGRVLAALYQRGGAAG